MDGVDDFETKYKFDEQVKCVFYKVSDLCKMASSGMFRISRCKSFVFSIFYIVLKRACKIRR